ncbi:endopeptidase La [Bacteriovorax sp. PP10]|uniref:Lon protease n=1 Tax=Bacteriovorax antarcticus TaxID=3088717 RepID=A0ABU5VQS3_9BACT|nr:endopeptidase La [Bacteriovorax sp. PP10]MEA9355386.1 endopeptidase La [Bacteriovorax sp. PP10]
MKTTHTITSEQFLPTLVLKNTVLFPDVALPVLVSKPVGLNALHRAIDNDKERRFVALSLKEGAEIDNIKSSDFYTVGTLCIVERIEKNEKGESIAYVRSVERFQAKSIQFESAFNSWAAQGEIVPDIIDLDGPTEKALLTSLKEVSREILASINATETFKRTLEEFKDAGLFTNVVAQHLPLIISKKQEILELASIKNRSLKVLELLVEQREMIKVNNEMGLKISEKTSKAYRESILREQLRTIKEELGEINSDTNEAGEKKSLKDRIMDAHLPKEIEKVALEQANRYETMGQQNAESHVIKNYVELILSLPWNEESKTELDLDLAQKVLDEEHFGLEKIKKHIVQHLAVMKLSPNKKGSILLFVGPPGVGKTSLGQSIAKALGRKFVRASLGGVRDDSDVRGHRRTYVGAMPGRIIEGIKRAKENNPVFMLDEIDKLGRGYGGDPAAALLEVLDPEQNSTFTDQYLDLPFDLSKVFFVATANSLDTIPHPLLDRMEIIQLSGYTSDEKLHIAKNHLLPKQLKEHGLTTDRVEVNDAVLKSVIADYTREAGVRDLQRKIAKLLRSVSEKVVKNADQAKIVIDNIIVEDVLGIEKNTYELAQATATPGVVTGLAWTPVGGDILFIESAMMPGTGKIQLTGKLGEVMSESAHIGLSLVRSKLSKLVPGFDFSKTDFHVHVPSGSIPKDGPSAGITIFTALCSLVLGKVVDPKLAMTGEITLRGAVMPVGGVKEKLIAAHRAGIKKIIMSKRNEKDLKEVPAVVKNEMEFFFVENINELMMAVFGKMSPPHFYESLLGPPYVEDFGMKNENGF